MILWIKYFFRFIKDFLIGLRAYWKAFIFIYEYNLWLYFIIPVCVSVGLLFGGDLILEEVKKIDFNGDLRSLDFHNKFSQLEFQDFVPEGGDIELMMNALKVVFVIAAFSFNKYLVLILLAPLNTLLSAKTERILTGNKYPFEYKQFVDDIYRTINFSLRNLIRQMGVIAVWYGFSLIIPFLSYFTDIFIFVVGAYYYGATLIDYNNERRRLSWEQSVRVIRKFAGITYATGAVFSLLFFSSYLGIVFGPILGVVAATIAMNDRIGLKRKTSIKQVIKQPLVKKSA